MEYSLFLKGLISPVKLIHCLFCGVLLQFTKSAAPLKLASADDGFSKETIILSNAVEVVQGGGGGGGRGGRGGSCLLVPSVDDSILVCDSVSVHSNC